MTFVPDGIPTRFVLPMVITASDHQALLRPDDLGADGEALLDQTLGDRRRVKGAATPAVLHLVDEAADLSPEDAERRAVAARLRCHFKRTDQLKRELAQLDAMIDGERRRFARLEGLVTPPRVEQLRAAVGAAR